MDDALEISAISRYWLEELRDDLNARYQQRKQRGAKIDNEGWLRHLRRRLLPLVDGAHATFPESCRRVLSDLYDVSLDLFTVGHFGESSGLLTRSLARLWEETLPRLCRHVARNPRRVAGSLSNAVLSLSQSNPHAVNRWLCALEACGAQADGVEQLLQLGQVAAWSTGVALYRQDALILAKRLPTQIVRSLLAISPTMNDSQVQRLLEQLQTDPWADGDATGSGRVAVQHIATCGAFRGFGGIFLFPPRVFVADGSLHVTDRQQVWRVIVDRFGHSFQRVDRPTQVPRSKTTNETPYIAADGKVRWQREAVVFPHLSRATSQAFDGTTLAVTLADSFHIYFLAHGSRTNDSR